MPDVFMCETGQQLLDQRFGALNKVPAAAGVESNRCKTPCACVCVCVCMCCYRCELCIFSSLVYNGGRLVADELWRQCAADLGEVVFL